jgi:hypothetical protein
MLDRDHYLIPTAAKSQAIIDRILSMRPGSGRAGEEGAEEADGEGEGR